MDEAMNVLDKLLVSMLILVVCWLWRRIEKKEWEDFVRYEGVPINQAPWWMLLFCERRYPPSGVKPWFVCASVLMVLWLIL